MSADDSTKKFCNSRIILGRKMTKVLFQFFFVMKLRRGKYFRSIFSFALRGSVIDLAIGIIIGSAFTRVVQSLVDDILTPPFGLLLGGVDFVNLTIEMKNFVYQKQPPVVVRYGKFIQTIISLFLMALALFFVMKAVNHLHQLAKRQLKKSEKGETKILVEQTDEVKLLTEIRDLLARNGTEK